MKAIPENQPLPGELTMKEFIISEHARLGDSATVIWNRIKGGKYPELSIRRVNKRVVFVSKQNT